MLTEIIDLVAEGFAMELTDQSAPIGCSLDRSGLAERARRWLALAERAIVGVTRTPGGLRLSFRAAPGVGAEVRELASLERECCAFASWTTRDVGDTVVLEVNGTSPVSVAAVRKMFATVRPTIQP